MGPTLGFLPPLECQKPDTGPPLGPQENVIELEGKLPPRDQHEPCSPPAGGGVTDIWWCPAAQDATNTGPHYSKPACS